MSLFDRQQDIERTDMVTFGTSSSDWKGAIPGNNLRQDRTASVKFTNNDTSVVMDWYEGYLQIKASLLLLADSSQTLATAKVSFAPGTFSLVKNLIVKSGGTQLYKGLGVAPIIFMRKALETGKAFSETIGTNELFVLDEPEKRALEIPVTHADPAKNVGAAARSFRTGFLQIPLNNWGFFKELKNRVLPAVQLDLEIIFDEDQNVIWGDSADYKLVIESVELKVPSLFFKAGRQEEILRRATEENEFYFPEETFREIEMNKLTKANVNIGEGVVRPITTFIYIKPTLAKTVDNRCYAFDTFKNEPNRLLLKYGNDTTKWFLNPSGYSGFDHRKMYHDAVNYAYRTNQTGGGGVCFDYWKWKNLYPFVHFDMRQMTPVGMAESKTLTLELDLGKTPAADYSLCTGLITMIRAAVKHVGGKSIVVRLG